MNERNVRLVQVLKAGLVGIVSVLVATIAFTTGFRAEKENIK